MKLVIAGLLMFCLGLSYAGRTFPQRVLAARGASADVSQPYWFLGAPRKGANSIRAIQIPDYNDVDDDDDEDNDEQKGSFSVVQDDDDENDSSYDDHIKEDNDESSDDDEESDLTGNVIGIINLDELEDKEVENDDDDDDEEFGETAIYLPRAALQNIPNGSILAVVDNPESMSRAMKKYYYRRRRGGNNRRRRGNKQRRRRRGGNRRRRRPVIRVIRPGATGVNRISNQRRRPNVIRL